MLAADAGLVTGDEGGGLRVSKMGKLQDKASWVSFIRSL